LTVGDETRVGCVREAEILHEKSERTEPAEPPTRLPGDAAVYGRVVR
jgi:hypothetical protein